MHFILMIGHIMGCKIPKQEYLKQKGIYTSYVCNNDVLINRVAALYFKEGFKIADVTYGKGVFWREVNLSLYDFFPSDILTCKENYDFRNLPYENDSFDVIVFDPPYAHNPGHMIVDANYKNAETTKGFYHKDIIQLYREGMIEAKRILKERGFLLIKCKDEIESSLQKRSHIEIWHIAVDELGFIDKDLFVLTQLSFPTIQHTNQKHARKNNSYLWVFIKDK